MWDYWLLVLSRTLTASFDSIGVNLSGVIYSILILLFGAIAIRMFYRKAFREHVLQNLVLLPIVAVLAWIPIFIWHSARSPYILHKEVSDQMEDTRAELDTWKQQVAEKDRMLAEATKSHATAQLEREKLQRQLRAAEEAAKEPLGDLIKRNLPKPIAVLRWVVLRPRVSDTSVNQPFLPTHSAGRVTGGFCIVEGKGNSTVAVNFDARHRITPKVPGTNLHTSDIVIDEDGTPFPPLLGRTINAANQVWNMSISAVTNNPTKLDCSLYVEKLH